MKKIISQILISMLCIIGLTNLFIINASASEISSTTTKTVEYLEDGIICETIIVETTPQKANRATSTKSGSKTVNYKNANGEILWYVTVNASFSYNGSTSSCKSASASAASLNGNWKVSNTSSSCSNNSGSATSTGKRYNGSTLVQTISRTVTLTCSKSGKLS